MKHLLKDDRAFVIAVFMVSVVAVCFMLFMKTLFAAEKPAAAERQRVSVSLLVDQCEAIDGDTVAVTATMRYLGRLDGIDTPERSREEEREAAAAVTAYVARWLASRKAISVEVIKHDKYGGRVLVRVNGDGEDLAKHLLDRGFARPYHGEKKARWTAEELAAIVAQAG